MEAAAAEVVVGGRPLSIEVGKVAGQANGSALVRCGDTVVLATAVMAETLREGIDFFPLLVEFEEKLYAAGRIPGGFFRREGKPSEKAVVTARMIDRPLRPLFPHGMRNDVQVVVVALSADPGSPPDVLGIIAASTALYVSDIPFTKPIGAVRVGRYRGDFVVNPTYHQLQESDLDLVVAGTRKAITLFEVSAKEVGEDELLRALEFAWPHVQKIIDLQEELRERVGKEKAKVPLFEVPGELKEAVRELAWEEICQALDGLEKPEREERLKAIKERVKEELKDRFPKEVEFASEAVDELVKERLRWLALEEGKRVDGRGLSDIRPVHCEVGLLPRAHGSGLFVRGRTQVITIATLGAPREEQLLDTILTEEETKRFMHHYNFPPYSTGEVRPLRAPSRREIGHGALVERALEPVIPPEEELPYTVRLVSEILESNGSTSMASACGSTLALMDAGVKIKAPVAGISIGLVTDKDRYKLLTDIQGIEDQHGDMDFKVAGTERGITAIQLDVKREVMNPEILSHALKQAREARLFILEKMREVMPEPRPHISPFAPRVVALKIDKSKIGDLIGPGGKVIRNIIEITKAKIDIEEDGRIYITAPDDESARKAKELVQMATGEIEVGQVLTGRVVKIYPFGAVVELGFGKEGFLHISQIADAYIPDIHQVLEEGEEVKVKVIEVDETTGRIRVSAKELGGVPKAQELVKRKGERPPRGPRRTVR